MKPPRILIPLTLIAIFGGGGAYVEHQRKLRYSALSGFFETQPTQVASRIQGRVKRILVHEGDRVRADQLLLELEAITNLRETRSSQGAAEQSRAQYLEVERGPRRQDIARQAAVVSELQADLDKLRHGSRPEEIAEARAAEGTARAHYAQLKRGLTTEERAELKARLENARSETIVTRTDVGRYRYLLEQKAVARQQYERKLADAQRAYEQQRDANQAYLRATRGTPPEELEQARQSWLQAKAAYDLALAGSRAEDIAAGEARLSQAQAQLDELREGSRREQIEASRAAARSARANAQLNQVRYDERLVHAPIAGTIERIPVSQGDLVNAGTTLLRVTDPNDIWVRVYVPEDRLANVKIGSPASLRIDGVAGELAAHAESIATQGEFKPANLQSPEERGRQVFGVRLRLDKPDERVKPGMFVTVTRLADWTP